MPNDPASFEDVLQYELEAVRRRREAVSETGPAKDVPDTRNIDDLRKAALDDGMVGLALSGGGVRSATFCLGFLQGLSRLNLLKTVDYLSTVSGGGFIGGWLTAWIHREEKRLGEDGKPIAGATANVEKQLDPDRRSEAQAERTVEVRGGEGTLGSEVLDDEPEPVYHLRAYSNYLAPRPAWFSGDMWTIYAIYARNTFVNLLILVPMVFAAVLLAYGLVWYFGLPGGGWGVLPAAGVVVTAVVALYQIRTSLSTLDAADDGASGGSVLYSLVNQPTVLNVLNRLGVTVSKRPVKWRFYGDIVFVTVCEAVFATWLFTTPPTPAAPAAATPHARESTWDVTLKAHPADEKGTLTIGPLKAHVKHDAPPPAPLADWVADALQVDVRGRSAEWSADEVYVSLPRPGGEAWVRIDRESGEAEFEDTDRGWISYLNDLHKGRNAGAAWSWFIDAFALACLVFTLTGLVILKMHAANRPGTWPLVGLGVVLPLLLALLFIH